MASRAFTGLPFIEKAENSGKGWLVDRRDGLNRL